MCQIGGPGPGAYRLPGLTGYHDHDTTRYRNPEFSFGIKPHGPSARESGPGPIYAIDQLTRFGHPSSPKYTMSPMIRQSRTVKDGPGPGAYRVECVKDAKAPAWSMPPRIPLKPAQSDSPGPAAYCIPESKYPPFYTMAGRGARMGVKDNLPGPASYGLSNIYVSKKTPPMYTMRPQVRVLEEKNTNPSPMEYIPQDFSSKRKPPSYSFGVKHACFETLCTLPEDNFPCD